MVAALDRKLRRDLRRQWAQILTIGLVVGAGITSYVALLGTSGALSGSQRDYYARLRLADVWVQVERAPHRLRARAEAIPGVAQVEARIVTPLRVLTDDAEQPPTGQVIGLPSGRQPRLGALDLHAGRLPLPGRPGEAVLLHRFAERRGIRIGDTVPVVMEGMRRDLIVVGTATSPEYIYPVPPGAVMADDSRYAVFWMDERTLAPLVRREAAFDELVVRLQPGASAVAVQDALDRLLDPYGGRGAFGRDRLPSHDAVSRELGELARMSRIIPLVFLGVAAFLLNVVLSRMIQLERGQIALLKAIGYSGWRIGRHYFGVVWLVLAIGVVFGGLCGNWAGMSLVALYSEVFGLPMPRSVLSFERMVVATGVALLASAVGAAGAVRRVLRLHAAEAMRAEPPPAYRRTLLERAGVFSVLSRPARMVARELARRRVRTGLTLLGIAGAMAILVFGRAYNDAVMHLLDVQFESAAREDLSVTFERPVDDDALSTLRHLPGVRTVESARVTSVRLRSGHRWREVVATGLPRDAQLRRVVDRYGRPVPRPPTGAVMTTQVARALGVRIGDTVEIEPREGARGRHPVVVTGFVDDIVGKNVYLPLDELNALHEEPGRISMALLRVDPAAMTDVERRLGDMPAVLSTQRREATIDRFAAQMNRSLVMVTVMVTSMASILVIGVVYNYARIVLSQRQRDLASLRVLGFTRQEISAVLLGEIAFQVLAALPIGLLLGRVLIGAILGGDPESMRLPAVSSPRTMAFAAMVTLLSGAASALLVRRKVDRLDLIGVLKTRTE